MTKRGKSRDRIRKNRHRSRDNRDRSRDGNNRTREYWECHKNASHLGLSCPEKKPGGSKDRSRDARGRTKDSDRDISKIRTPFNRSRVNSSEPGVALAGSRDRNNHMVASFGNAEEEKSDSDKGDMDVRLLEQEQDGFGQWPAWGTHGPGEPLANTAGQPVAASEGPAPENGCRDFFPRGGSRGWPASDGHKRSF